MGDARKSKGKTNDARRVELIKNDREASLRFSSTAYMCLHPQKVVKTCSQGTFKTTCIMEQLEKCDGSTRGK